MKCFQNIEIDGLVFLGCIYPRLTTDNTAVGPIGPMGAGKLRAGVRVRALIPAKVRDFPGKACELILALW